MKSRLFLLFVLLAVAGCLRPANVHLVYTISLEDIPHNPTFTVVPAEPNQEETAFANIIEGELIRLRMPVVSPPVVKQVVERRSGSAIAASSAVESNSGVAAGAKDSNLSRSETFVDLGESKADYVVNTFFSSGRSIRIIRNDSKKQVVANFFLLDFYAWKDIDDAFLSVLRRLPVDTVQLNKAMYVPSHSVVTLNDGSSFNVVILMEDERSYTVSRTDGPYGNRSKLKKASIRKLTRID